MEKSISMKIVNPHAAGIDVGSRSHFVAVGQDREDVREFGVYNEDLQSIVLWLRENKIATVALESTGTYWQALYAVLQESGFQVILCNGKFTKNIKDRKTDVQDCQWIQKLHTIGLLSGSFLPDEATEQLRTYCRHRTNLIDIAADTTRKMQKYLRLFNLRLDVVVNDITGLTGISIIDAVCKGEKNPQKLASLRNGNCKKSEEEIAKAWLRLSPNNRISGGKILSSRTLKGSNLLKTDLLNAANAIGNLKGTPLSNFFLRISFRKGRSSAISATARKLPVIIWNMIVKNQPYRNEHGYEFLDQIRKRKVLEAKKLIQKFSINMNELALSINTI